MKNFVQKLKGNHILVIKLSALGDFVLSLGAMKAIRDHHPDARLSLLTTKPFVELAEATRYFNDIWVDERPKLWELFKLARLEVLFNTYWFSRVYDLQCNQRTRMYYEFFYFQPPWNGRIKGSKLYYDHPDPKSLHPLDRQKQQLKVAGIENVPDPQFPFKKGKTFITPRRYAVLIPGCSPEHPEKRWPAEKFATLAYYLMQKGVTPVLVGTKDEEKALQFIEKNVDGAINLMGRTSLFDLANLCKGAVVSVGNDTGPSHIAALCQKPVLVLFSHETHPEISAPRGKNVLILRKERLEDLDVEEVVAKINSVL